MPAAPPRSPEQGRFLLLCGVCALAILAVVVISYRRFFTNPGGPGGTLTDAETMDIAQLARNMATGHGFATSIWRPLAVTGFAGPDSSGVAPDITHPPLYPFILMLAAMAHGGHLGDNTVVLVSLVLFLASVLAVYRLARTLFPAPEQAPIALLSAGFYTIGGDAIFYAIAGLPVALATLLVTLLLIALHRAHEIPGRPARVGSALAVGLLLGLCYLTQYSLLLLALPALVYLFFSRAPERAWAGVGACVLGFFLIAGPWMVRNAHLGHGNPIFTLLFYSIMDNSSAYPGHTSIYRSAMPEIGPLAYFYTHLPDMLARGGRGLTYYRDNLLEAFNVLLLAAAVASLLWRVTDERVNALRGYGAFCLLAIVVLTTLFLPDVKSIAPFAPLITVVAVGYIFSVLAQQNWEPLLQRTAIWSLGLLIGLGALIQFVGRTPALPNPVAGGIAQLSSLGLAANKAVITDTPFDVSWRTGLPSVWLPTDNAAYEAVKAAVQQKDVSIQAMLLTPMLVNYDLGAGEAAPWFTLSKQPDEITRHAQFVQRLNQQIAALVKARDPRVMTMTRDQLQSVEGSQLKKLDPEYDALDLISDIATSFTPSQPVVEANSFRSTLFLPGDPVGK